MDKKKFWLTQDLVSAIPTVTNLQVYPQPDENRSPSFPSWEKLVRASLTALCLSYGSVSRGQWEGFRSHMKVEHLQQ